MNVSITSMPHFCHMTVLIMGHFKIKNSYYTFLCKLCIALWHTVAVYCTFLLKCYASAIYSINSETAHNKHAVYYRSSTNSGMLVQK